MVYETSFHIFVSIVRSSQQKCTVLEFKLNRTVSQKKEKKKKKYLTILKTKLAV